MTHCPGCRVELPPDALTNCPVCFKRLAPLPPITKGDRLAVRLLFGGVGCLLIGLLFAVDASVAGAVVGTGLGVVLLAAAFFCLPRNRQ